MLSNTARIEEITKNLGEPTWLFNWRKERLKSASSLPDRKKYSVGILGVEYAQGMESGGVAEYSVDATKGLEVYTWKEAIAQEELVPHIKRLMQSEFFPTGIHRQAEIGSAFFRSGLVVYVQPTIDDEGHCQKESLTITTTLEAKNSADVVIVIVKEGSRLELKNLYRGGGAEFACARTLVVLLEKDASVEVTSKTDLERGTRLSLVQRAIIPAHSSLRWTDVLTSNVTVSSHTESWLIGEGAITDIIHGALAADSAVYDVFASARHIAPQTSSRIRSVGVVTDCAHIIYRGLIDVIKGVSSVVGNEEAKFFALGEKTRIDAIPSLDIASKDVACTHKLSVSHIRENDIFYPKLRGLSETDSRMLFLAGHFSDIFTEDQNNEIIGDIHKMLYARAI